MISKSLKMKCACEAATQELSAGSRMNLALHLQTFPAIMLLYCYAVLTSFYLWICNKRYLLPLILLKLRYATSILPSSSASLPSHVHYRTILVLSLRNEKASQNHFQRVSDSWDRRWGWEHLWRWLALDLSKGSADMTFLDVLLATAQSQFFIRVSQLILIVLWL